MTDQNLSLRPERETDHTIVENVTREAFWNHHGPGCNEHYLLHVLRGGSQRQSRSIPRR